MKPPQQRSNQNQSEDLALAQKLKGPEILGEDFDQAIRLLDEGHDLKAAIETMTERIEAIKMELLQIQIAHDCDGFRNGRLAFIGSYRKGRRMLSKDALLENGVSPEQIAKSYREGDAYWNKELKVLKV